MPLALKELAGLGVLVTRPAHQAKPFIHKLQQAGAEVFALPAIEIVPLDDVKQDSLAADHTHWDWVIFSSANAVIHTGAKIYQALVSKPRVAAIGSATAKTLNEHGIHVDDMPQQHFTSEALLALENFREQNISGNQILIISGESGREYLTSTLQARGATVTNTRVYRRICPQVDVNWLQPLWHNKRIQLVCVTSNETLDNLYRMLPAQRAALLQTHLLVPGDRAQQLASTLGFQHILQAASATDAAMLLAIVNSYPSLISTGQ